MASPPQVAAPSSAPPAPVVTSTPASRQGRLQRLLILRARLEGLKGLVEQERSALESEMRQAGALKMLLDEGESFFRTKRSPRVTDPVRLAGIVSAVILAEHFKPTVAFVEGLQKAGKDWQSCIQVDEPEEFRVERAKTPAARAFHKQIMEDTAQRAAQVADALAARLAAPAQNPPANV